MSDISSSFLIGAEMRKTIAALLAGVLLLGTVGCGSRSGQATLKASDPGARNTDPPEATKFPVRRK